CRRRTDWSGRGDRLPPWQPPQRRLGVVNADDPPCTLADLHGSSAVIEIVTSPPLGPTGVRDHEVVPLGDSERDRADWGRRFAPRLGAEPVAVHAERVYSIRPGHE